MMTGSFLASSLTMLMATFSGVPLVVIGPHADQRT